MQVGDYIIRPKYRNDNVHMLIGVITKVELDGYLRIDVMCNYNTIAMRYTAALITKDVAWTNTKDTKLYHPTLEELFIFKQLKEQ